MTSRLILTASQVDLPFCLGHLVIGHFSTMYHFHVNVFAHPYKITWEQAAEALEALPRMIFEPDGSWIWSGGVRADRWQIDGHLFDFEDRLHRVELRGQCPEEAFDRLLSCFGWPQADLTYEQVLEGTTLNEKEFRQRATTQTSK